LRCKPFQDALDEQPLASDADLLQKLMDTGYAFLLSDSLYVDDTLVPNNARPVTFENSLGKALVSRHPFGALRHGLTELSERAEQPAEVELLRPVQLHIAHSWGGGLGRWVEDYIEADNAHHNLVLRSIGVRGEFGQSIALYSTAG